MGSTFRDAFPCHRQHLGRTACYLSSLAYDRRLGCLPKHGGVFTSRNRLGWEEWEILDTGLNDDTVYIRSQWHERSYLASDSQGKIYVSRNALGNERWQLEKSPHLDGSGFFIVSAAQRKQLVCDAEGKVFVAGDETHYRGDRETWKVEARVDSRPCLLTTSIDGRRWMLSCDDDGDVVLSRRPTAHAQEQSGRGRGVFAHLWRKISLPSDDVLPLVVFKRFSSASGRTHLASTQGGEVFVGQERASWEKWVLSPQTSSGGFFVLSQHHDRFLSWRRNPAGKPILETRPVIAGVRPTDWWLQNTTIVRVQPKHVGPRPVFTGITPFLAKLETATRRRYFDLLVGARAAAQRIADFYESFSLSRRIGEAFVRTGDGCRRFGRNGAERAQLVFRILRYGVLSGTRQDEWPLCNICFVAPRNAAFLHANGRAHSYACLACSQECRRRRARCPICRGIVEQVVEIILN